MTAIIIIIIIIINIIIIIIIIQAILQQQSGAVPGDQLLVPNTTEKISNFSFDSHCSSCLWSCSFPVVNIPLRSQSITFSHLHLHLLLK
jgi:hypothetical protein